jgi:hypothetical protein
MITSRPTQPDATGWQDTFKVEINDGTPASSLMNTDLFRRLINERVELNRRIKTIEQETSMVSREHWLTIWRKEYAATNRAIWALGDQA